MTGGISIKSFRYRIRDQEGIIHRGTTAAESEEKAILLLIDKGNYVLHLSTQEESGVRFNLNPKTWRKVSSRDTTWFVRQLSSLVGSGVPLIRCLKVLEEQAGSFSLKTAVADVSRDLERGESLSTALAAQKRIFPPIAFYMVKSGEAGGVLDEVLQRLAVYMEKEQRLYKQVKGAALYPALLAFFALCVVFFLIGYVIPRLIRAFHYDVSTLPGPTQMIISLSGLADWLWLLIMLIIGVVLALKWYKGTSSGLMIMDRLYLTLPVVGPIIRKLTITRFARSLGILVQSGVNIIEALEVSGNTVGNAHLARAIRNIRHGVHHGLTVADAIRANQVFDPLVIQMVVVGEETGRLDNALLKVAEYYEDEAEHLIKSVVSLLEPILIIIMALVVGLIVSGTILPMLDMMTAF